jgi:hypothetical protein
MCWAKAEWLSVALCCAALLPLVGSPAAADTPTVQELLAAQDKDLENQLVGWGKSAFTLQVVDRRVSANPMLNHPRSESNAPARGAHSMRPWIAIAVLLSSATGGCGWAEPFVGAHHPPSHHGDLRDTVTR